MNNDRAHAYGRVVATIEDLSAVKLQPQEVDVVREAADTLLFAADHATGEAREALDGAEALARHLADSGRWTEERAQRLFDDIVACGPLARVF